MTTLTFILTLEQQERFATSRAVGAYVGLRPRQRQSGGRNPELHITKAGDRDLRRLLVQSAHRGRGRNRQKGIDAPDHTEPRRAGRVHVTFGRWRRARRRGTPIPEALWRMAVGVASKHGVSQASLALRLDYYALKRRLAATEGSPAQSSTTEFVELSMPASNHVGRCQVEIRDALGDTMRIDVSGLCT